jgi:HD-like signal output (HDOD) protein/CheY-like chemotaxis protein
VSARPHILFVDDEASMLSGLRRMLYARRSRWDMTFALGAEEALATLGARSCDVIVSDYRMPGMDGAALLQVVRDRYPGTARLILSGHTDEEDLLKVLLLAHQFLNKPCQQDELLAAIERVISLRAAFVNETVRGEVEGIESLPSPPSTLRDLFAVLDSADASVASVARVIEQDPAATARVLQVVNSSSFMVSRRIGDVSQAVSLLGLRNVRALVLMHDLVRSFDAEESLPADWVRRLTKHSVETSRLARHLAGGADWADDAFAAGLLHEIGQLVLASCRPAAFNVHLAAWMENAGPLGAIESETFGVTHAAAGGYLLGLWGLPLPVIEAVLAHDTAAVTGADPPRVDSIGVAVALAHALVETELGPLCGKRDEPPAVDEERLDPVLRERIAAWRRERSRTEG